MLHTSHTGIRSFNCADRKRNVPGKWDVLFFRFVSDGEERVTRKIAVDLDEVVPAALDAPHSRARFAFILHPNVCIAAFRTIYTAPNGGEARGNEFTSCNTVTPFS